MRVATVLVLWQALSLAGPLALHFEKNVGQSGGQVQYLAKVRSATIFVEDDGFVLYRSSGDRATQIQIRVEGTNPSASWQPQEPVGGTTSYLIGNDPRAWIRDVPHFQRLVRKNIYSGIDLILYGSEGRLEYDFVLAPGADAKQIRTRISGANALQFAPNGDLVLAPSDGGIRAVG